MSCYISYFKQKTSTCEPQVGHMWVTSGLFCGSVGQMGQQVLLTFNCVTHIVMCGFEEKRHFLPNLLCPLLQRYSISLKRNNKCYTHSYIMRGGERKNFDKLIAYIAVYKLAQAND